MKTRPVGVRLSTTVAAVATLLTTPAAADVPLEKTTVTYRVVEGHPILADVLRPGSDAIRPVIVYLHGGALIGGERDLKPEYRPTREIVSLAKARGYALVSFDYRLAPETKLPAIVSDVEAAFAWLGGAGVRQFHLDPAHMVVVGDSAGGYLALLSGYRVSPKPKAIISLFGYGSLDADWYNKPNPYPAYTKKKFSEADIKPFLNGAVVSDARLRKSTYDDAYAYYLYVRQNGLWTREVSGFDAASLASRIAPYEPVRNVDRDYPPTLLVHGTMDTDVPHEESVKMAQQFEDHGVPYIFKSVSTAEHGLVGGNPAETDQAYKTMDQFIIRYLEAK